MSDKTKIEWTDATWNPVTGCSVVSPGCTNCYAMQLAGTRLKHIPSRKGLTTMSKAGPVWNGEVRLNWPWLYQPLSWTKPRMIFVCAHGDLFHESVPDEWIDQVFAVMALSPQHTFQVLTKRAERMAKYVNSKQGKGDASICTKINKIPSKLGNRNGSLEWPLPNVWLGVSAEDQKRADERIPHLLATPAAVRFVSAEPLLGLIDFKSICDGWKFTDAMAGYHYHDEGNAREDCLKLDWVIVGGESGPRARPMHPEWARSIRDVCKAADVPFFFKQWGEWTPGANVHRRTGSCKTASWFADEWDFGKENLAYTDGHVDDEPDLYRIGKKAAGHHLDGVVHFELPEAAA